MSHAELKNHQAINATLSNIQTEYKAGQKLQNILSSEDTSNTNHVNFQDGPSS